MRKSLAIYMLTLALCAPQGGVALRAQSSQEVHVLEYKGKEAKTPLPGVSLTVQNAGSTISDDLGRMTLQFRTLRAGGKVQVRRVDLVGFEIFNQDAVDQWIISPEHPFMLSLCQSETFRALREQYMRLSSESYARQLAKDQERLAAQRKANKIKEEEYRQQLAELEDQYNEQLDNLENYVDRFARIDLSALSEQEQNLLALIQGGNIDEAIRLYEEIDYLGQYVAQVEDLHKISQAQERLAQMEAEKEEARGRLEEAIYRQAQTYQIAGGQENWQKIGTLYKGAADADTTQLLPVLNYATFAGGKRDYAEAERYLGIFLRQCGDNLQRRSWGLSRLARVYAERGAYEQAEALLDQAIDLQNRWKAQDPGVDGADLAELLCYRHSLYIVWGRYDQTRALAERLSPLLSELDERSPQEGWWKERAVLAGEQAVVAIAVDEDEARADDLVRTAYALGKQKCNYESNDDLHAFANLLLTIRMVLDAKEDLEGGLVYQNEQAEILERLYRNHPDSYRRYLLEAYNNMADTYVLLQRADQASPYIDRALGLLPDLKSQLGNDAALYEMCLYDTMASFYQLRSEPDKMRDYAARCLQAFDLLSSEEKGLYDEVRERWTASPDVQ